MFEMLFKSRIKPLVVFGLIHLGPKLFQQRRKTSGPIDALFQQFGKFAFGQQVHIFGKHGKNAAHEKMRDLFRRVVFLKRFAHFRQPVGNLACDPRIFPRGV